MSGWGQRGGAHLLLGEASVPLATCGQGGARGPFLQRTEPETGRWPGHLELAGEAGDTGSPGSWESGAGKGEALIEGEEVCLACAYWQGWLAYRGSQEIPIPACTSPPLALAGALRCPPGSQNLLCHPLTQKKPWA